MRASPTIFFLLPTVLAVAQADISISNSNTTSSGSSSLPSPTGTRNSTHPVQIVYPNGTVHWSNATGSTNFTDGAYFRILLLGTSQKPSNFSTMTTSLGASSVGSLSVTATELESATATLLLSSLSGSQTRSSETDSQSSGNISPSPTASHSSNDSSASGSNVESLLSSKTAASPPASATKTESKDNAFSKVDSAISASKTDNSVSKSASDQSKSAASSETQSKITGSAQLSASFDSNTNPQSDSKTQQNKSASPSESQSKVTGSTKPTASSDAGTQSPSGSKTEESKSASQSASQSQAKNTGTAQSLASSDTESDSPSDSKSVAQKTETKKATATTNSVQPSITGDSSLEGILSSISVSAKPTSSHSTTTAVSKGDDHDIPPGAWAGLGMLLVGLGPLIMAFINRAPANPAAGMAFTCRGLECIANVPPKPYIPPNFVNAPFTPKIDFSTAKPVVDGLKRIPEAVELFEKFGLPPGGMPACDGKPFRRRSEELEKRNIITDLVTAPFKVLSCAVKGAEKLSGELGKAAPNAAEIVRLSMSMGDLADAMNMLEAQNKPKAPGSNQEDTLAAPGAISPMPSTSDMALGPDNITPEQVDAPLAAMGGLFGAFSMTLSGYVLATMPPVSRTTVTSSSVSLSSLKAAASSVSVSSLASKTASSPPTPNSKEATTFQTSIKPSSPTSNPCPLATPLTGK